jgi:hypothetical protein
MPANSIWPVRHAVVNGRYLRIPAAHDMNRSLEIAAGHTAVGYHADLLISPEFD